jgi:hypothetical protein
VSTHTSEAERIGSTRERTAKSGEKSWNVLYRHGSRQASKTFETAEAADRFKDLVGLLGPDRALKVLAEESPKGPGKTLDELFELWLASREVTPQVLRDHRGQ